MSRMWSKKTILNAVLVILLSVISGVCLDTKIALFLAHQYWQLEPSASFDVPAFIKFKTPIEKCLFFCYWPILIVVIILWRFFTFSFQPGKLMVSWENEDQNTRRQGQPHESENAEEILVSYIISIWIGAMCILPANSEALQPHFNSHINRPSPRIDFRPFAIIMAPSKPQHRKRYGGVQKLRDGMHPVQRRAAAKKTGSYSFELAGMSPVMYFDALSHYSPPFCPQFHLGWWPHSQDCLQFPIAAWLIDITEKEAAAWGYCLIMRPFACERAFRGWREIGCTLCSNVFSKASRRDLGW